MADRPYTLLSYAMSIDGYLDTATDERLMLSNDADFDLPPTPIKVTVTSRVRLDPSADFFVTGEIDSTPMPTRYCCRRPTRAREVGLAEDRERDRALAGSGLPLRSRRRKYA